MPVGFSKEHVIVRKDFFIVFILLFNTFAWFYMTLIMIDNILTSLSVTYTQNLIVRAAYFISIVGSSIVGSALSNKISRLNFLYIWMILGIVISLVFVPINNFAVIHILFFCILLGISFGLGMPSCLAYFTDHTPIENRGRIGGTIFLTTNLSAPLLVMALNMFGLISNLIFLAVWRGLGLIVFFLKPEKNSASEKKKDISFISVLHDKSFLLYFIAWLMFCLIDRFERPVLANLLGDFYYLMIGPIIGSFFALIAGVLSDRVGRKRVVLYGFVTLGIAYAVIGIAPATLFSWYFFLTIESIATGILWVTFILILWGDLSQFSTGEKYYAIGEAPYFLTFIIQLL
ncbi:MAG: MFS transporter, partial [Candidatus Thorarchaeota archaeon]|nr:MFS transporter [Candidatus Thorarchaeota archaeon]